MNRTGHGAVLLGAMGLLAAPAHASTIVFTENFESDVSASWNTNAGVTDHAVDYSYDYSAVGIPSAPGSGGTTKGLKLQANLTNGIFGGFSVSPTGLDLPEDFILSFDLWSNFNGPFPAGGSGSTNLSTYGVFTSGTFANSAGVIDSLLFATTADGGSASDWRIYSPEATTSYIAGHPFYADPTTNHTGATYTVFGGVAAPAAQLALFPQQTGSTEVGSAGMAWHEVTIEKAGNIVTWRVGGVLIGTVDITAFAGDLGGTNILFGHADTNATSSTDPNDTSLLFTLIDNVQVTDTEIPEPASWGLAALGLLALGAAKRKNRA